MAPIVGILYDGEERKSVRIMVRPRCEFPAVLAIFNAMRFPDTGVPDEQISFAILELVSNSMRAHVERGSEDSIVIRLWIKGHLFMATVSDRGGGFDPARLPYSFDAPVASLNVMAPEFIAYRERYDNSTVRHGPRRGPQDIPDLFLNVRRRFRRGARLAVARHRGYENRAWLAHERQRA